MKTLILRVGELQPADKEFAYDGFPIDLLLDEGTKGGWHPKTIANDRIPADLSVPNPPQPASLGRPLQVGEVRSLVLAESQESDVFEAIGKLLYQLLARQGIREAWEQLRDAAAREGAPRLRTVLEFAPPSKARPAGVERGRPAGIVDLRLLPWELLSALPDRLFANRDEPLMRGIIPSASKRQRDPLAWPIVVLVVVGSPQDPKIGWQAELRAIRNAVCPLRHWFDLEVLEGPDRATLTTKCKTLQPHILHFIGHGHQAVAGSKASLEIHQGGGVWDWTTDEIYSLLRAAPPRLAIVNACRTSVPAVQEGGWDVAQALLRAGAAAVVGMQGDIDGAAAALFGGQLYAALAEGASIDHAVAAAREGLIEAGLLYKRDWALPALQVAVLPELVLPMDPEMSQAGVAKILNDRAFQDITSFVDRNPERRAVRSGLEPRGETSPADLLIARGEVEIGKTWLVKCCLQGCAARGHQVVYVDLKEDKPINVVEILRRIRGPSRPQPDSLLRPWLHPHFWRFNEELNHLLRGQEPPEPAAVQRQVEDEGTPFVADTAHPQLLNRIFEPFLAGLRAAAGAQPLVIALDHLTGPPGGVVPSDFRDYLLPRLVLPIAKHDVKPVRMILAVRVEDEILDLTDLLPWAGAVVLEKIPEKDFKTLAEDYLFLSKVNRVSTVAIVKVVQDTLKGSSWKPRTLLDVSRLLRGLP